MSGGMVKRIHKCFERFFTVYFNQHSYAPIAISFEFIEHCPMLRELI